MHVPTVTLVLLVACPAVSQALLHVVRRVLVVVALVAGRNVPLVLVGLPSFAASRLAALSSVLVALPTLRVVRLLSTAGESALVVAVLLILTVGFLLTAVVLTALLLAPAPVLLVPVSSTALLLASVLLTATLVLTRPARSRFGQVGTERVRVADVRPSGRLVTRSVALVVTALVLLGLALLGLVLL